MCVTLLVNVCADRIPFSAMQRFQSIILHQTVDLVLIICVSARFSLPYGMVIAVASLDSVVLYDTQSNIPIGFLSNMHYASLTDIAW